MKNCEYCKKPSGVLQKVHITVQDHRPHDGETIQEDSHGNRTNNTRQPLNKRRVMELCYSCIQEADSNGFLVINKVGHKETSPKRTRK